jgi:hypothetical protein
LRGKSDGSQAGAGGELSKQTEARADEELSYALRCLPRAEAAKFDPRVQSGMRLEELSDHIRKHPTVPADSDDTSEPMRQAFDDSLAVLLPRKHCAFKNCTWKHDWSDATVADGPRRDDEKLLAHVMESHKGSADLLPGCFSLRERVFATCDEAIAVKVREGAPLASYSID